MHTLILYRSGKQFGWRIKARNGQIVATAHELYKKRSSMIHTLENLFLTDSGWLFRIVDETTCK